MYKQKAKWVSFYRSDVSWRMGTVGLYWYTLIVTCQQCRVFHSGNNIKPSFTENNIYFSVLACTDLWFKPYSVAHIPLACDLFDVTNPKRNTTYTIFSVCVCACVCLYLCNNTYVPIHYQWQDAGGASMIKHDIFSTKTPSKIQTLEWHVLNTINVPGFVMSVLS